MTKFWNRIRLAYNELAYWLIGLPPESYHSAAASIWSDLENHRRAIDHCNRYLELSQSDHIKALLGYGYYQLGDNRSSLNAYRSLDSPFTEPLFALGLAEAELNVGNFERAQEIVIAVAKSQEEIGSQISVLMKHLESRLAVSQRDSLEGKKTPVSTSNSTGEA